MSESIGLSVASETPVCVLNVMRGGPSTGIPTKSEQGDLSIALHGLHGDAPHLVLAPLDVADCVFTTGWAVTLAQYLQTAAIVLSDQFLGQSTAVVSAPRRCEWRPPAPTAAGDNEFLRYRLTDSGLSTLAFPGDPDHRYTADGLEHNERGTPSAGETDHRRQLDKRRAKLVDFDFGDDWARISGDGPVVLLAFGSAASAIEEAASLLDAAGIEVTTVALRLLAPLPAAALAAVLADCSQLVVVEQNHGAQLCHYLRSQLELPPWSSYAVPGPVPLSAEAIARFTMEVLAA
jgi:2-oxoglutarate ferredoxin oxidoreductase subunit alpha